MPTLGRAQRRWLRIVRHSRTVNVGWAPNAEPSKRGKFSTGTAQPTPFTTSCARILNAH